MPINRQLMLDLLKDYRRPNDKISELLRQGMLLTLRRGLYMVSPKISDTQPSPWIIANHLYGPSYVSLQSALAFYGMIPERSYETSSVALKVARSYQNDMGRFSYQRVPLPYYSFGLKSISLGSTQSALMASPEKAICDLIVLTPYVNLRSKKNTLTYLLDDLRMDEDSLKKLNLPLISSWLDDAPKKESLQTLIHTIHSL
jgi:hypothetical protein